jgi:hypothetical protein
MLISTLAETAAYRFALAVTMALLSLTGCAPLPPRPIADSLQHVTIPRFFVLDEPLFWRIDYRPADVGLMPGGYRATEENALGTFFEGPPGSYFLLSDDEKSGSYAERTDGGLWIPKDGGSVKVWAWFDANHKLTIHTLDRRGTPNEILAAMTGEAGGTQAPTTGRTSASDGATQMVVQRISLGQVPRGVAGGAAAGIGGAIGGLIIDAIVNRDVGMRNVAFFIPTTGKASRQFDAIRLTVKNGSPQP